MAGQLDLFGAARAEAEARPAAGKGRAPARPEPASTPPDPKALVNVLADGAPEKQNPSREGFDSAAERRVRDWLADQPGQMPEPVTRALSRILSDGTPPLSLAESLAAIAELIREPERWCKGCSARNAKGRPTLPGAADAVCLSAYGAFAFLRTRGRIDDQTALKLWLELDSATPNRTRFARWHDAPFTSHAEVLALIEVLKNRERGP